MTITAEATTPTRHASRAEAEAQASELRAWATETAQALRSFLDDLDRRRTKVRAAHPLPPVAVSEDGQSLLRGTHAFTSEHGFADHRDAGHLGRLALAAQEIEPLARPLIDELQSVITRLTRPRFRRRSVDATVAAINDALVLREEFHRSGLRDALNTCLDMASHPEPSPGTVAAGLASAHGLPLPEVTDVVTPAADIALLDSVRSAAGSLTSRREAWAAEARKVFAQVQERKDEERLRTLDLDTLRQACEGTIRTAPLADAGITSVLDVIEFRTGIPGIPGIGLETAHRIIAAASRLREEVRADNRRRIRIDRKPDDPLLTRLVSTLVRIMDLDERSRSLQGDLSRVSSLMAPWARTPQGDVLLVHSTTPRRGRDVARVLAHEAVTARNLRLDGLFDTAPGTANPADVWEIFRQRATPMYGLLAEILGIEEDLDPAQGHMSAEIAEQVANQHLNLALMKTSLRGYQAFGAKFALVQRKVVLGDEMGLGKTIQALAAMAHLADGGEKHFLVVCPAGVLVNWLKEIPRHSSLTAWRLHGPDRADALRRWKARGGVAVTTYGTLRGGLDLGSVSLGMLVADEAHLLKNPDTLQSRAVKTVVDTSTRALFLTGTPIENVVAEFRNLIAHLQPDVADRLDTAAALIGASSFRELISPVYLRRIADDVLQELPDLQLDERWVDFTDGEQEAYYDAIEDSSFPLMRRVAYVAERSASSKAQQVKELVDEAVANGKKVLVFSYFKEVLAVLEETLGEVVIGTIRGDVTPERRQQLAEQLAASPTPRVLLSQIAAGGVGMNLQSASVVILCEPQVKPSLEDQAIKRAHRMGQVDKVTVYRVLTPDSVDQRLLDILEEKRQLIADLVHTSAVADSSPEAKDMTDIEVSRLVIAQEVERNREALARRRLQRPTRPFGGDGCDTSPSDSSAAPALSRPTGRDSSSADVGNEEVIRRVTPPPTPQPPRRQVCGSCDRPINDVGHCGCS